MKFFRPSFLVLIALILGGGKVFAVNEERALAAATAAFQAKMWNRAEMEFAQFRQNFPDSTNVPQAILLQAQSDFQQKKFSDAIELLKANQPAAKNSEDQFVYWIGESQFASSNYLDAADTFISLAQNFPASDFAGRSVVEAAASLAQLNNWPVVESLLETNSIFSSPQEIADSEMAARGQMLLARSKFEQKKFEGAVNVLKSINPKILSPDLAWERLDLLCRVKSGAGDLTGALAVTTNMLQVAGSRKNLAAEAVALRGDLFQKSGLPDAAVAEYQKNLKANVPLERQREAILKIAEIFAAQNQLGNASERLNSFLLQFSNAPAADMALLTLGEFHLKNFAADRSSTNELQQAAGRFDQFIGTFTNSPLLGKAFLDRGWCDWFAQDIANSLLDFETAAQKLPPSDDLAVAKFKTGDALFAQNNFVGARTNYDAALGFTNFPDVINALGARALYQSLRANLELNDYNGATNAMMHMLGSRQFRTNELMPNAELLYAEGLGDWGKPAAARDTFQIFERQWPNSPMQPQAEFAIAHTYELERNWPAAIEKYQNWLVEFPTNESQPRVDYSLAWANYQAGNETNAAALFQNFIAQFSANDLAPQAQFWLGDYFYRNKEFVSAETNYELVYQKWPASDLAYPSQLMAGRAAAGRGGNSDAIKYYFKPLITDTNCPPDVAVQARFGWGTALMTSDLGTTNPIANFYPATNVFAQIVQIYPANDYGALAWCYIGECDVQISDYDSATNAYAQVFNSTNANVSLRSRARVGFGDALEKKGDLAGDADKKIFLQQALNSYLDVFETGFGSNLADGEKADPFWVKEAGQRALRLIQTLNIAPPDGFIDEMEKLLPQLKESLEKKRAELSPPKS